MPPQQLPRECLGIGCMGYAFDSEGGELCDDGCYSQNPCPANISNEVRWKKQIAEIRARHFADQPEKEIEE